LATSQQEASSQFARALPWAERSPPFAQLSAEESALQLLLRLEKVQVMKMQWQLQLMRT
jgi:hypothetical protein